MMRPARNPSQPCDPCDHGKYSHQPCPACDGHPEGLSCSKCGGASLEAGGSEVKKPAQRLTSAPPAKTTRLMF